MLKKILLVTFYLVSLTGKTQQNISLSSSEILLSLKKLNTLGSVLYIAAHPDDENTRLLAYLASEKKLRTGYLSLTRGDGGQNLVGKEQGELLGIIRTQELLAARRTDGAEQFFTRANDFGYSKTPEETFDIWNKDSILSDVVLTIRRFKPDVIICRFPTTGEGGHGHHTASAILAVEAFDAAADPKKFPEQLKTVATWKAKRIYWNTFNFGTTNTTAPNQLKTDVGVYNALLGKSYGEIASESRSMHKSQGFGSARQRGANIEYFKFLKGDSASVDLFQNINTSWNRVEGLSTTGKMIDLCIKNFIPESPEKSLQQLTAIYKEITRLPEKNDETKYWKKIKLRETENLIMVCSGLWLEAFATDYSAVPGQEISYQVQFVNRTGAPVKMNSFSWLNNSDSTLSLDLKTNELYTFKRKEKIPAEVIYSNPYWLNEKHSTGLYTIKNQNDIGRPQNESSLKISFSITVAGMSLGLTRDLVYKYTDPVKGELYRPFEIIPPVTINLSEKSFVFSDQQPKTVSFTIKANKAKFSGKLQLKTTDGWEVNIPASEFTIENKGEEIILEALITPGKDAQNGRIEASVSCEEGTFSKSITRITYDHIPNQFLLTDASARLVRLDIQKSGTSIGYIPGAGDDVVACLNQIGYNVTILNDDYIKHGDLTKFSAIITGVRAYNTNDRLQIFYQKLLQYVNTGGNLVVQYNTNSRVGPLQAKIGPYPFNISRDRVTDEKAEVVFKNEKHSVLNFPNKITKNDFDGWLQERGIYFATDADKNYETVLGMKDPKEKEHEGSLIISKYGAGNFVYTGLAFFRQLPAGVPGAYRLFVNILSLPKNQ